MIRIEEPGYEVRIGHGTLIELAQRLTAGRIFIVTDSHVAAAGWADRVATLLSQPPLGMHVLSPGEESKNLREVEILLERLLEAGVQRDDYIVAIGGGVIGDVAGFAAAILKRGCRFIQVPTSLLAQADAAIGGKTGVNSRHGKNLIGAFHHPELVVIDLETLDTLPRAEIVSGYAEIVKYGLIGDRSFFAWCEQYGPAVVAGDRSARCRAIERSVRAKLDHIIGDEQDRSGQRALLNFGHSFAHALEAETNIRHGEAVAIGMTLAFRLSVEAGHCAPEEAARVEAHLANVGLPTQLANVSPQRLVAHMRHDKKRQGGRLMLVLARGIGEAFIDDKVTPHALEAFLSRRVRTGESTYLGVG